MAKINLPNIYSQWDSRWANTLLGFNTNPQYNIYNYGCLITCLSMVARYYKKETDPGSINTTLKSINGYTASSGNYVYGSFTKIYSDIKEKLTTTPAALSDAQMAEIRTAVDSGYPVMIKMDVNPRTVALDMHFVLVIGYNPSDENDLIIADPLGGKERSLKDYLGWYRPSARKTIEAYAIYTGNVPKQNSDTVCLAKDDADRRTHNSEQWIKIHGYLSLEGDPALTQFEDAQAVIAGIKSTNTSLKTQLDTANTNLAAKSQEVINKDNQISTINSELLTKEKEHKAQMQALKDSMPDVSKLTKQYEGIISGLEGKVKETQGVVDELRIELAKCKGVENDVTEAQNLIAKLWQLIIKYMGNVFTKS